MRFRVLVIIIIEFILAGSIKCATAQVLPITVKDIEIIGNTVFHSELEALAATLIGQEVSLEQIIGLRSKITKYYVEQGYRNSGAFFPPQNFQDGTIRIQVIEGTLAAVEFKGLRNITESHLTSRLPEEGKPLNFNQLRRSLDRLGGEPLIKKINAEIVQQSVGKNILKLELEENKPLSVEAVTTNAYSELIGRFGGNIRASHYNFFGNGSQLSVNFSGTEGLSRIGGFYSFPINTLDGRISFGYSKAENELIKKPIKNFGIEADNEVFSFDFEQPIILSRSESLNLGFAINHTRGETFILNGEISFPFTEGLKDGRTNTTVLSFIQEYTKKGNTTLLIASSKFNVGIDAFDATISDLGIDGSFWSWNGKLEYFNALDEKRGVVLATSISLQFTPDQLLSIQQFPIGGINNLDGYPPNFIVADNGVLGRAELRLPLLERENWDITIVPFLNLATVWNNQKKIDSSTNTFASIGLGLRSQLEQNIGIGFNYSIPLIEYTENGGNEDRFTFFLLFK